MTKIGFDKHQLHFAIVDTARTHLHDEIAPHEFHPTIVVSALIRIVDYCDLYHFLRVNLSIKELLTQPETLCITCIENEKMNSVKLFVVGVKNYIDQAVDVPPNLLSRMIGSFPARTK